MDFHEYVAKLHIRGIESDLIRVIVNIRKPVY